jgi:uncharacterized membrane protein YheB (UPF0754 family)
MGWAAIAGDFREHWHVYVSMPFIAAIIGYVTKVVAIRMMFQPIEFRGIGPIGWQGIVPRRAARMAAIATETMTRNLISVEEIFGRLDPERIARQLEPAMLRAIDDITREVAAEYQPGLWEAMPEAARRLLIRRIQNEAPRLIKALMEDLRRDVHSVLDLKNMVVTNLVRDRALLNRIFQESGRKEFQFIARIGAPFGFAIGLVQLVAWALTHNPLVLPIFGGFTGYFTDWLALKMIFRPKEQRRYLGLFTWQGLFIKRRAEVAADYGRLIASEIITPAKLFEAVLRGPLSDKVFLLVQRQVQRAVDDQAGLVKPFVVFAVGSTRYQQMKRAVAQRVMERLPEAMHEVEDYAADALDLRNTLVTKMQQLTDDEYENLLRPAFKQDEWILVTVGAILGALVGELQAFLLLH